ncbi:CPBP family intramembrane glutamic endopeptidase [Thermicanus aegyptius]|uniref:CPBP family intramembrane glutamic endopeptidase n=1 Tax=Thermicanus aegyptius TaxID=94009 RepID=UPI0012EC34A2|nr:type II CAAX endopeptidase family protein [Thermicanus aegyptius]
MPKRWVLALLYNFFLLTSLGLAGLLLWKGKEFFSVLFALFSLQHFPMDFLLGVGSALLFLSLLYFLHKLHAVDLPENRYTRLLRYLVSKPFGPFLLSFTSSISEELLFRGFFLPFLATFIGSWLSLLIIALLFMALHVPQYGKKAIIHLFIFFVGIMLGLLFFRRETLWAPIFAHFFYNLASSFWMRKLFMKNN